MGTPVENNSMNGPQNLELHVDAEDDFIVVRVEDMDKGEDLVEVLLEDRETAMSVMADLQAAIEEVF